MGGSGPRQPWRALSEELRSYFADEGVGVRAALAREAEGTEARELAVAAAFGEAEGFELPLACDAGCSYALEPLLAEASLEQLAAFVTAVGADGGFATAAGSPFGSRVCEAALRAADAHLAADHGAASAALGDALGAWCEGALTGALELLANKFGSHALRALLSTLRGYNVDADAAGAGGKSAKGKGGAAAAARAAERRLAEKLQGVARTHAQRSGSNAHAGFPEMCGALVLELSEAARPHLWEMQVHTAAGPVLQAMLECSRGDASQLAQMTSIILCAKDGKTNVEAVDPDGFVELCQDRSGSHLAEAALRCADEALHGRIFRHLFRGRLSGLVAHGTANFVVQALLASERSEAQLAMALDELEAVFPTLLPRAASSAGGVGSSRAGVVAAAVGACSRLRVHEKRIGRALASALAARMGGGGSDAGAGAGPASEELVRELLYLDGRGEGAACSILGSAMLAMVLKFPMEAAQRFVEGFGRLTNEEMSAMAKDRSGGRALEALLASNYVEAVTKNRAVAKLEGTFAALAQMPHSSFTVERCYSHAGTRQKETITSELFSARESLKDSKYGARLLQHCSVQAYAGGAEDWAAAAASKERKKSEFNELFGGPEPHDNFNYEDGKYADDAGGANENGGRSARKEDAVKEAARALGGNKLDGAMEALGFGRKGGKNVESDRGDAAGGKRGDDDIDKAFNKSGKKDKDKSVDGKKRKSKEEKLAAKEAKRLRKLAKAEGRDADAGGSKDEEGDEGAPQHDESLANVLAAVERTKPKKRKKKDK